MKLVDVMHMAKDYLLRGCLLIAVLAAVFAVGYFVIYKKICKGSKKLNGKRICWLAVFICYLFIVFAATLLDRAAYWEYNKLLPLFYSYKEAWNQFSLGAWRNIVLNILMFVPIGFLLPIGIQKCRHFFCTYVVGFLLTLTIELLQLGLKRGIFELDDIFNNLMGAMIGYGCYVLLLNIYKLIRKEKPQWKRTVALQFPLVLIIGLFGTIFLIYEKQELGNLNLAYIVKYDTDELQIETTETYSTEERKVPVYQVPVVSEEKSVEFAKAFFQKIGTKLDESSNDMYDESAYFRSVDSHSVWITYLGGTYTVTDFDRMPSYSDEEKIPQESEETIRKAVEQYGITIPKEAEFNYSEEWGYQFLANQLSDGEFMYDGTLTCRYYVNGGFGDINNSVIKCEKYKEFPIISEQDAYQRICEGKFKATVNGVLEITLGKPKLAYAVDSKGFYQPVYKFEAVINGDSSTISIPALKN